MKDSRKDFIRGYVDDVEKMLASMAGELEQKIDKLATILIEARDRKNTIFIMGNGGSAATASHLAGDLAKGTIMEGLPRFKVIALTDSTPSMLAWANDVSYEEIFVEQLKNFMESGDVVIGISGSGNSMNIIRAIDYANENGGITIGLSGYDGGRLLKSARENIHVPNFSMQKVEDIHLLIGHILIYSVRE